VDASVGDQALDGLLRDLAAVRIEAGKDDRAWCVVDDQVYAGGPIPWVGAVISRSSKENTITNACMARNGYLAQ